MIEKTKKILIGIKNKLKKLNKNIRIITKNTNKIYIIILLDILLCKILYNTSSYEYRIYEFYNINHNKRKTYLSKYRYELKRKIHNNKKILNVINNKEKLNLRLKKYLNREVVNVNSLSYKEFENIMFETKKILCRSINSKFIDSYKIFNLEDFRGPGFILEKIKDDKLLLVEKSFNQNKTLNKISSSLVLINVTTISNDNKSEVLSLTISFKENDKIIKGFIDSKTMCIKGHLRCNNEIYKEEVIPYKIPHLKDIITYAKSISLELSEQKEIEWSFALSENNDIYLLDANIWDDYEFVQIREYLNNSIGILPKYKNILLNLKED
ncbi:MAG: hypothetical protein PUA90_02185 [bacterium]|nr:hypothetical protein [bacterium]